MEYRYHRMVLNENDGKSPHIGRLNQSNDYVGENGFGHEDWNFAKDVWDDGKFHLYLRQSPSKKNRNSIFNIIFGVRTDFGHRVVGFAENVTYQTSTLDESIWERRARELQALEKNNSLGGSWKGLSVKETIAKIKLSEAESYNVAVSPKDLIILVEPFLIPTNVCEIKSNRYQLLKVTEDQYQMLRDSVSHSAEFGTTAESNFPEGKLVERAHKVRERDSKLVRAAKKKFVEKNGNLCCEICGWNPVDYYRNPDLRDLIIEAHHDQPLSHPDHPGTTKLEDLRMLCPNCHRVIHRIRPWVKVDDFKFLG